MQKNCRRGFRMPLAGMGSEVEESGAAAVLSDIW